TRFCLQPIWLPGIGSGHAVRFRVTSSLDRSLLDSDALIPFVLVWPREPNMIDRRSFLASAASPFLVSPASTQTPGSSPALRSLARHIVSRPLAITMWDF